MYKIFYCGQMCPHEMFVCQKKLPVQGASLFGLRNLRFYFTCTVLVWTMFRPRMIAMYWPVGRFSNCTCL